MLIGCFPLLSVSGDIFVMFLKEVSYVHQGCIYLIKNIVKHSNIAICFYSITIVH